MKLFDPDNPIINGLNDLTDLIILGILWLICSIPIITIGASSTALCYAYNKHFKHKEGHATKLFFHSFRKAFKQSTIVWLIMAVILVVPIGVAQIGILAGMTMTIIIMAVQQVATVVQVVQWIFLTF